MKEEEAEKMKRFEVRLDKDLHEKLRMESFHSGKSMHEIVIELIKKHYEERGKKMKKYELMKKDIEINWRDKDKIVEGCTMEQGDCDPELIKSFDNKDEALEKLKNYKSDIRELKGNLGTYFEVTEYYIVENTYDEDGDFVEGGDVWEFSQMPIL